MTTSILSRFSTTMTTELARHDDDGAMAVMGKYADAYAQLTVFDEHDREISDNTRKAHQGDLMVFCKYLAEAAAAAALKGIVLDVPTGTALRTDPFAWRGVSYGLVKGFREWQLQNGYSMSTVNRRLSTVRKYATMAAEAGAVDVDVLAKVRLVGGKSGTAAKRIDEGREVTRIGSKRTHDQMVALTEEQIHTLKQYPDPTTPQGRRDRLMLALMLDYGLRVSEVVGIVMRGKVNCRNEIKDVGIDMEDETITIYRPKVDNIDTFDLTPDVGKALRQYINAGDAPPMGELLRGSRKGGKLTHAGLSTTAASARVTTLAEEALGVHVSAHDMRHSAFTWYGENHPDKEHIWKRYGGWTERSKMPSNYIKRRQVANRGFNISI